MIELPNIRQTTDYTCGAASLLSVLNYYGLCEDSEMDLAEELEKATHSPELQDVHYSRLAVRRRRKQLLSEATRRCKPAENSFEGFIRMLATHYPAIAVHEQLIATLLLQRHALPQLVVNSHVRRRSESG